MSLTVDNRNNLYEEGMNVIISSGIMYSMAFITTGRQVLEQLKKLKKQNAYNLSSEQIQIIDLVIFLSEFYKFSNVFIERISFYFSDIIRKNTLRDDIRGKTSTAIAEEIRRESFFKFDEVISKFSQTMKELGVQLESVSTIRNAVEGTFLGGGMQLLASKGKSSSTGMVVGALIGVVAAEVEKAQLREKLISNAFEGIRETLEILPICNEKLMDQYSSYIYGHKIDFNERDNQITRGKRMLQEIKFHCSIILEKILSGHKILTSAIEKTKNTEVGYGCLIWFISFILIVSMLRSSFENEDSAVGVGLLLSALVTVVYIQWVQKKRQFSNKERILDSLKSQLSKDSQLEESIVALENIQEQINTGIK